MNTAELNALLAAFGEKPVSFVLPDGGRIPDHAHITEVGRIDREFLDCGGAMRRTSFCCLQAWVADDTDHRLSAGKLKAIISRALEPLGLAALPVEIEFEDGLISQFPLLSVSAGDAVVLHLGTKHTDCLAKEICLPVPGAAAGCGTPGSGCC
ncbi:MAG: DUF6428 family protein [Verrucomicrobia bacterium]|nr:DUF6428 family protein [Verrucomicrobiota bacterium]